MHYRTPRRSLETWADENTRFSLKVLSAIAVVLLIGLLYVYA